jgi:hypothetical protein
MRAFEFLAEASALNLKKVTKHPGRAEKFIELIQKGHQFNSDTGPVTLDPEQIPYLQSVLKQENVGVLRDIKVTTIDGKTMPMGKLHFDQAAWGEFGKGGDATANVKPGAAFQHGDPEKGKDVTADLAVNLGAFPASDLANKVINNEHIKNQGQIGEAVIEITKQIDGGQLPDVPAGLSKKAVSTIQNDAFEYLGILEFHTPFVIIRNIVAISSLPCSS